jgi:hypothetical protein
MNMKIPRMSKTAKIIVVLVVLVLLGAAIFWFTRLKPAGYVTRQKGELPSPPPPSVTTSEEKPMGQVRIEMERVLTKWCKIEAPFEDEVKLKDLWLRRFPTTPKYQSKGINQLIAHIRENELFGKCNPAHIKPGLFVEGGAIQKVGDLHSFLNPCEPHD